MERVPYDEFSMFHENAEEFGLPYDEPPTVRRASVELEPGRRLSALVWGDGDPELVFLHGGAQNAHTWDTVAMALGRPLVALDLPGHGHSDGGRNGSVDVASNAEDVAVAIRALAPDARAVVGMSLGGMTTIALADHAPDLVRKVVLVDVTPGVNESKSSVIAEFINGPESFDSFDDLLARTIEYNPTRTESSLRRGHPPQRRAARGRQLGVALPALPRLRADRAHRRDRRHRSPQLRLPVGRGLAHPGAGAADARHARAVGGRRRRRGRAAAPAARRAGRALRGGRPQPPGRHPGRARGSRSRGSSSADPAQSRGCHGLRAADADSEPERDEVHARHLPARTPRRQPR